MIEAKFTGKLSVGGVGRVGSYSSAKRGKYCRARQYWAIFEDYPDVKVERVGSTEIRRIHEERLDLGKFKTKTAAISRLLQEAAIMGLTIEGDVAGYPRLTIPTQRKAKK